MSTTAQIEAMLRRLTTAAAENIDDLVTPFDGRHNPVGRPVFPEAVLPTFRETSFKKADAVFIGVRVDAPRENLADMALELGALAIENDAEIVVLSSLDYSGLERFGFRSERITGATPEAREACLEQLRCFWGLELII